MWLYSGKSGCIRGKVCNGAKVVVFGKKWLYFRKLFVFRECGCIPARWLYLVKNGCDQAKLALFGQKWLYLGKVLLFGQKWL